MRTLSIASLVVLVCSSACSGSDSKPADAKSDPAPADASKPADANKPADASTPADASKPDTADKRAKAREKITVSDPATLKQRKTTMLTALNQGRKLVKDGKLEEGIAKYNELLAIDPHYGPALGELGWAEFRAGRLDQAHAHTLRALALATDDNKRGMLLYNLGRIAEDRLQTEAAIDHYRESLRARPNETVAARLAKLTPDAAPPTLAAAPTAGGPVGLAVIGRSLASIGAACELAGRQSMCSTDDDCSLIASPAGDERWGALYFAEQGFVHCWNPIIKTGAGWVLFETALLGQHGSEIDQDVDAIAGRVLSNDAGEFLLIEFSDHVYERDWRWVDLEDEDFPPQDTIESEGVIVCRIEGDAAHCTAPIITKYEFTNGIDRQANYSADLNLRGDTILITNVRREGEVSSYSTELQLLDAGEYPFAKLAASPKP
jgi:tetratricopeptide (TPR) repeat protein